MRYDRATNCNTEQQHRQIRKVPMDLASVGHTHNGLQCKGGIPPSATIVPTMRVYHASIPRSAPSNRTCGFPDFGQYAQALKSVATPAGFEPATFSLEV